MYYPCSENKDADQLRGYREPDLRLWFRICRLFFFFAHKCTKKNKKHKWQFLSPLRSRMPVSFSSHLFHHSLIRDLSFFCPRFFF